MYCLHYRDATAFLFDKYPRFVNATVVEDYAARWRGLSCKFDPKIDLSWDAYLVRSTEYVELWNQSLGGYMAANGEMKCFLWLFVCAGPHGGLH